MPNALIGELIKMNCLKYATMIFALVAGVSITAFAQKNEGDKKIPKPEPPIVIVNDKKNDGKSDDKNRDDKRGNKPQYYFSY